MGGGEEMAGSTGTESIMSAEAASLHGQVDFLARDYRSAARKQELAFWIGSALAAVCSAIAGLGVAGDLGLWEPPLGKIFGSLLAVVPAVWIAADRSLQLRRLSLFNYGVAVEMAALAAEMKYAGMSLEAAAKRYSEVLRQEHRSFTDLLTAEENSGRSRDNTGQGRADQQPHTLQGPHKVSGPHG